MRKFYFLSLIIFFALLVFATIMIGCVSCFFDIPSLLMVLLCTIFMLLSSYSFSDIGKYFSISFIKQTADVKDIKNGIIFFRALQKYLLLSGGIGAMMGLVGMLAMLDDPDKIGIGMALALITILYALFFCMAISVPFSTALKKKLTELGK